MMGILCNVQTGRSCKCFNDCHDYFSIAVPTTRGSPSYQVSSSSGGGPRHVGITSGL